MTETNQNCVVWSCESPRLSLEKATRKVMEANYSFSDVRKNFFVDFIYFFRISKFLNS